MRLDFRIDDETGIFVFTVTGKFDLERIARGIDEAVAHPSFEPGNRSLWDMRDLDVEEFGTEQIEELVRINEKFESVRGAGRAAAVTSRDVQYGLGRMFEAYADRLQSGFQARVFRTVDEAMVWLTDDSPD